MNLLSGSNFLFPIIDYKVGVVLPTPVMYIVFWTIWRGKVLVKLIYGAKIAKTSPKPRAQSWTRNICGLLRWKWKCFCWMRDMNSAG